MAGRGCVHPVFTRCCDDVLSIIVDVRYWFLAFEDGQSSGVISSGGGERWRLVISDEIPHWRPHERRGRSDNLSSISLLAMDLGFSGGSVKRLRVSGSPDSLDVDGNLDDGGAYQTEWCFPHVGELSGILGR